MLQDVPYPLHGVSLSLHVLMSSAVHVDSLADEALALSIPVEPSSRASLQQPQGWDGPSFAVGDFCRQRRGVADWQVPTSTWPSTSSSQLLKFEMRAATPDSCEMRAFAELRARRHHRNGSDRTPECFIGTVSTWHSPAADLQCICRKESIDSCDWICSAQGYHLA